MKLDLHKTYVTRNGKKAVILDRSYEGLDGAFVVSKGYIQPHHWQTNGKSIKTNSEALDIVSEWKDPSLCVKS